MKNVLQIIDTPNWAINKLASAIVKYNPKYNFETIFVHPKDLEQGHVDLADIKESIERADIIDAQYWRTCSQLLEKIPEMKEKKIILTHHNEKNLLSADWTDIDLHIAKTKYSFDILNAKYEGKVRLIYNSFDHETFKFNDDYPPSDKRVGYVGRTSPWKGLKEIAQACAELGYELLFMGKMDKPSYFNSIPQEHRDIIDWNYLDCPDEERPNAYKDMTIYVGNSGPGREVGTLGVIEAMACGIPVVTTRAGIMNDIGKHEKNCLIADFNDYESLKENISRLMQSASLRSKLRKNAWNTIKNYNNERMAKEYSRAFNEILFNKKPLVSVIIPATKEREECVSKILLILEESTYKNIEAIVIWDELDDVEIGVLGTDKLSYPINQLNTNKLGYNLAMARNLGIIEAEGEYLMFCDSRLLPDKDSITNFIMPMAAKTWLFGNKNNDKKTFIENFSFISKENIVSAGMFNERINEYGGMSQELRERFGDQGFEFKFIEEAKCSELKTSKTRSDRRQQIIRMKNLLWKLRN